MLTLQGIGYAVQVAAALATAVGIRSYASVPRSARPAARRGSLLELAALLWALGTILTVAPASDHPAHDHPCPVEWGIYAAVCVTALAIAAMRQRRGRSGTDPAAPDASGVVHDDREASYR